MIRSGRCSEKQFVTRACCEVDFLTQAHRGLEHPPKNETVPSTFECRLIFLILLHFFDVELEKVLFLALEDLLLLLVNPVWVFHMGSPSCMKSGIFLR